jgi:glyoxylase-like metal-dependent hydrolase (beta-lactamase superfamily II)
VATVTGDRPVKQEQEPASTGVTEIGPDVLRLQLPIQMPGLGHVNTYVLVDERGVALVDPGLPGPASWTALQERLRSVGLKIGDVHTVLVTHSHPDHFGGSGQLANETGADVLAHSAFAPWLMADPAPEREIFDVDTDEMPVRAPFEADTPWGTEWLRPPNAELLGEWIRPSPTRWLRNGEVVKLARREWFIVHTPGHTLDHICLHDPEAGILLSGDHVLPTITPHIAGLGAGHDPLTAFQASLKRISGIDGVKLVLPAHGHPFTDLAGRCEAIRVHHEERLARLRDISQEVGPAGVIELSHHLFRPEVWGGMAESETYAHLEHLRLLGLADRHGEGREMVYLLAPRSA